MILIDHIEGFWGISLCAWGLIEIYTSFRIRRFIIKRYEQETDLLSTIYFKEHATFSKNFPSLISSSLYSAHLISFFWGWKFFRKKRPFRDINDPKEITHHFTKKEIRLVKRYVIIGIIIILQCGIHTIFEFIWPVILS